MRPPIPPPLASSTAFAPVIILTPRRSRFLACWWVALHVIALAAVPWLGLPSSAAIGAAALLVGHAIVRSPLARPTPVLRLEAGGVWSVPELDLAGLSLGPRTRYTSFWVRLALVGPARLDILLLADQLDGDGWRALQARLRRGSVADPRSGAGREAPRDLR